MNNATELAELSANKCFGGWQKRYSHRSKVLNCEMHFSVFIPPAAEKVAKLPVLYWLSGLTCTDENFSTKEVKRFNLYGREFLHQSWGATHSSRIGYYVNHARY